MTKLEIKIKNPRLASPSDKKFGAYLATFIKSDDRILIFGWKGLHSVIDSDSGELCVQLGQYDTNYTKLKKIKKMTIEVELE